MKYILKLYQTYKNINGRIYHYVTLTQMLYAILIAVILVALPISPLIYLVTTMWETYFIGSLMVAALTTVGGIFAYYYVYFFALKKIEPKLVEVNIKVVYVIDSILVSLFLITFIIIFMFQLKEGGLQ